MKAWIAKDRELLGVCLFEKKPFKSGLRDIWMPQPESGYIFLPSSDLPEGINPQWEDEEPIEVELIEVKLTIKKI